MRCALTSRIFCVDFWSFLTLPEVVGSCARIRFDEYLWCHCRLTVIRDLNINSKKKIINSIQLGRKRDYACIEHEAGNLVRYVQPRILLICHFNLSVFFWDCKNSKKSRPRSWPITKESSNQTSQSCHNVNTCSRRKTREKRVRQNHNEFSISFHWLSLWREARFF